MYGVPERNALYQGVKRSYAGMRACLNEFSYLPGSRRREYCANRFSRDEKACELAVIFLTIQGENVGRDGPPGRNAIPDTYILILAGGNCWEKLPPRRLAGPGFDDDSRVDRPTERKTNRSPLLRPGQVLVPPKLRLEIEGGGGFQC